MPHRSITQHIILAHNGEVHTRTKAETAPAVDHSTAQVTHTATVESSAIGSPMFLGESLLLLIVVMPLILWKVRHQRMVR